MAQESRWRNYDWLDASRLTSVTDFVGTTSYTYNTYFLWLVKQVTQPNGAKSEYSFDVHARLDQIKPPKPADGKLGGVHNDYIYYDDGNPFYIDEILQDAGDITTRTFYDALGRALQTRRWNVNSDLGAADVVTDNKYDSLGRTTCVSAPYLDTTNRGAYTGAASCITLANQDFVYDALGEQTKAIAYNGAETNTAVDGRDRRVTDPLSGVTTYRSDDLGRLVKVIEPTGGATMDYAYDLADNLTGVTGPNGALTTMTYDKLGRKLTMIDPDMGSWSYDYNPSGDLERQTDANGKQLCFYYDLAGRLTTKRRQVPETTDCPATAGGDLLADYTYYTTGGDKGLLKTVENDRTGDAWFKDTYDYDFRGRMVSIAREIGAESYFLSTGYDLLDRPIGLSYVAGELVTIGYDGEYPTSISGIASMVVDLDYNVYGQLEHIDRPGTNMDTDPGYYNETENFRVAAIQHGSIGGNLPDYSFSQYDNMGRLTEVAMNQFGNSETQTFGYDALGRLTSAKATGTPTSFNYDYTYTYGLDGNLNKRTNRTPNPDLDRNYNYDTTSAPFHYHAVETISGDGMAATFGYDANGNMTSRTVNGTVYTQAFDVENRLESVTAGGQTTTFYYDADGNRILTVQPNNTKVYTPFPEYEESITSGGTRTQRRHYYLAGQLIAVRVRTGTTGNGTLSFAFNDHLGSVVAWADSAGAYQSDSTSRYEPYGGYRLKPLASINPSISDRGYTGHRQNNTGSYDLGLIYMNARYYLPEIGRFISADTIVPDPQTPQAFNRYSYSYNNPINYSDSSGHCVDGVSTWVCLAVGLKIVDYGWTAYDTWQAGRTLADPDASSDAKMMAGLTISLSVLFEAIEPDDILPVGLPADDVARRAVVSGAREALEEGGPEALEGFLRNQLGDHADEVLQKLGFNTSSFANSDRLLAHFQKHGAEFGYQTADDYLRGAQQLFNGGGEIRSFVRANGDQLFYNAATNEFGVLSSDGIIRTYFKPQEGLECWLAQIGQ